MDSYCCSCWRNARQSCRNMHALVADGANSGRIQCSLLRSSKMLDRDSHKGRWPVEPPCRTKGSQYFDVYLFFDTPAMFISCIASLATILAVLSVKLFNWTNEASCL